MTVFCLLCFSVCHVFDLGLPGWARGWSFRLHLQARGEEMEIFFDMRWVKLTVGTLESKWNCNMTLRECLSFIFMGESFLKQVKTSSTSQTVKSCNHMSVCSVCSEKMNTTIVIPVISVRFQLAQPKVNPSVMYVTPLFWTHQIKATLDNGYKNAVIKYNGTESKNPVDTIQRNVSGRFSITLVALHLSDFMFLCTHQRALVYMNILKVNSTLNAQEHSPWTMLLSSLSSQRENPQHSFVFFSFFCCDSLLLVALLRGV